MSLTRVGVQSGWTIAAVEAHARGGEGVEVGRFVGLAAVGAERFVAEVVGHDEDDIWLLRVGGLGERSEESTRQSG